MFHSVPAENNQFFTETLLCTVKIKMWLAVSSLLHWPGNIQQLWKCYLSAVWSSCHSIHSGACMMWIIHPRAPTTVQWKRMPSLCGYCACRHVKVGIPTKVAV